MSTVRLPTGTDDERETAIARASLAIQRGELIVLPTDTVYGLAADAFDADAVTDLLDAKGRGREMPPPVLVSSATTLDALAVRVPQYARALVDAFWPGPLTLVCHQQSSLQWDLGDTRGTVAIRMPDHPIAREILERTGPLAVSSANLTGQPAATDAVGAEEMLGDEVAVIVDAGPAPGGEASTIVDATGATPRILRLGALSEAQLDTVLGPLGLALGGTHDGAATEGPETFEGSEAPAEPPAKNTAARKTATRTTPAAKKAPVKKAPVKKAPVKKATAATKAPAAAKAPVAKKAPAAKKAPVAKKTPAVKKAPVAKKAPAVKKAPVAKAPPTPPAPE